MKKLIFILILSALFTLNKAMAVTLYFGNAPERISPSTPVEHISVNIAGLNKDQVNSLPGAFSLDFSYDPSILAWNNFNVTWGRYFGNPIDDQEAVARANLASPGLIQLDLVSLLSPTELSNLRGDRVTFPLFTLDFQPIPAGFTPPVVNRGFIEVKLTNVVLSDVLGNEITNVNLLNNPLHIELVPEINAASAPVGLALLIGGCLLLWERSRGRYQLAQSGSCL